MKNFIPMICLAFMLYPIYKGFTSYNMGKGKHFVERLNSSKNGFNKKDTSSQSPTYQNIIKPDSILKTKKNGFQEELIIGKTKYNYCFSSIYTFDKEKKGLFHIYRAKSNEFLIKLMLATKLNDFPNDGLKLNLLRNNTSLSDSGLIELTANIKKDILQWKK